MSSIQKIFKAGQMIIKEGHASNAFYIIRQGKVEVVKRKDNREVWINQLGANDFFGEMSLLDPTVNVHNTTIRAVEDTTVVIMEKEDFEKSNKFFKLAIKKDKKYGQILGLANQANLEGDKDKALAILELAVKIHPEDPEVYYAIGEYYLKEGDKNKALEYFSKCLEIDQNFTKAKDLLEKLKEK